MAQFQVGKTGNPSGSNRTRRVKKRITELLEQALPVIEKELQTASPEDRRSFFIDLANVAYPSQKQTV